MRAETPGSNIEKLVLNLYVSGMTARSISAIKNIKELCEECYIDCYVLEIFDLYKDPSIAKDHQIVFSPSLVKTHPLPRKVLIGDLSDKEKVKNALGYTKA